MGWFFSVLLFYVGCTIKCEAALQAGILIASGLFAIAGSIGLKDLGGKK